MLAATSTHKRKRSAQRADKARKVARLQDRAVVTLAPGRGDGAKAWGKLRQSIQSHPLNHSLSIVLPRGSQSAASSSRSTVPPLSTHLQPPTSYMAHVPLALFLDPTFITSHIKRGSLIALSSGRLDADDVFCLDGKGNLHISVTKPTYRVLGLEGRRSQFARTSSGKMGDRQSGDVERWIITFPLTSASFVPGRPGYERTLSRIRDWDTARSLGVDISELTEAQRVDAAKGPRFQGERASWQTLFAWTSPDHEAEGSSLSSQRIVFPKRQVAPDEIRELSQAWRSEELDDVWVPSLKGGAQSNEWSALLRGWEEGTGSGSLPKPDAGEWKEGMARLLEWSALVSLKAECIRTHFRASEHVHYEVASPRVVGEVSLYRLKGMVHSQVIWDVVERVQAHLDALVKDESASRGAGQMKGAGKEKERPWAVVHCGGWEDSPVAWLAPTCQKGRGKEGGAKPTQKGKTPELEEVLRAMGDEEPAGMDIDADSEAEGSEDGDGSQESDEESDEEDGSSDESGDDGPLGKVLKRRADGTGPAARRARAKRAKRRGHVRRGVAEHGSGSNARGGAGRVNGWSLVLVGGRRGGADEDEDGARWILVENTGEDLHN